MRPVIRLGPLRAELWRATADGALPWALDGHWPSDQAEGPARPAAALAAALAEAKTGGARSIDMVVESALAPVMLLPTGKPGLGRQQIEALARHRFSQWYDDRGRTPGAHELIDATGAWQLRISHRPGDDVALASGLPGRVRQLVDDAARSAGIAVASLQPAFAWGWQALARRRRSALPRDGGVLGWVWCEQDRALASCWQQDRLLALNAGAALPSDLLACDAQLAIEALRSGLERPQTAAVGGWQPLPEGRPAGRSTGLWIGEPLPMARPQAAPAVAT